MFDWVNTAVWDRERVKEPYQKPHMLTKHILMYLRKGMRSSSSSKLPRLLCSVCTYTMWYLMCAINLNYCSQLAIWHWCLKVNQAQIRVVGRWMVFFASNLMWCVLRATYYCCLLRSLCQFTFDASQVGILRSFEMQNSDDPDLN